MARIISGLRIARSFVTPQAAEVVSRELDFQLGSDQGIQIEAVLGLGVVTDTTPAVSDTTLISAEGIQSLHMETGSLEDVPIAIAEDADDIDTEIFYAQHMAHVSQVPSTVGGGGGALVVTPSGLVTFAQPIQTARNITHRGETLATGQAGRMHVYVYYRFVQFTNAELGFLLARRQ